jgi:hypothetical protein
MKNNRDSLIPENGVGEFFKALCQMLGLSLVKQNKIYFFLEAV